MQSPFFNLYNHGFARVAVAVPDCKVADPGFNAERTIALAETGRWWKMILKRRQPFDYVHFNSAEPVGDAMVMSFRHLDAVYKIDRASGEIIWKLGGTPTDERLEVLNDPHGDFPFGGQHDARVDEREPQREHDEPVADLPAARRRFLALELLEVRGTAAGRRGGDGHGDELVVAVRDHFEDGVREPVRARIDAHELASRARAVRGHPFAGIVEAARRYCRRRSRARRFA